MDVIEECRVALANLDPLSIKYTLVALERAERIFCFGNGGGASHASHFAADLRKIARKQAFAFDSIGELTARINDDGWESAWYDWIDSFPAIGDPRTDILFLFSVGGGSNGVSSNLPRAQYGIVGAESGRFDRIVIPSTSTPVVEGCQSVIAHHLVEQLCS